MAKALDYKRELKEVFSPCERVLRERRFLLFWEV